MCGKREGGERGEQQRVVQTAGHVLLYENEVLRVAALIAMALLLKLKVCCHHKASI